MRPLLLQRSVPRLQIVVCDVLRRTVVGALSIEAAIGTVAPAVVGSHPLCDLRFDGEPALARRHLMVAVSPLRAGPSGPEFTFRVVDLRTRHGFADEDGRSLRSITADGTVFVVIGRHLLCFLSTSDHEYWPEDGHDAWSCVPERVYLAEQLLAPSDAYVRAAPPAVDAPSATTVRSHDASRLLRPEVTTEPLAGHLTLVSIAHATVRDQVLVLPVSARHVEDGALLGRLDGADLDWPSLRHPKISRGHILLINVESRFVAIDAASTNGSFLVTAAGSAERRRCFDVVEGTRFTIGDKLVQAQWSPA